MSCFVFVALAAPENGPYMGFVTTTSSPSSLQECLIASHIPGLTPWVMRTSSWAASNLFFFLIFCAMASLTSASVL